jgi:two-component system sensor histidine kinase UhpB
VTKRDSAVRVLIVEQDGLAQPPLDGLLDPAADKELVRARSLTEAQQLIGSRSFDLVIADETRFRGVLDAMFTFVGLFSLSGVVLDVNQAPLAASGLGRDAVVGHRFVELPWFAHSASERDRITTAIASAARGEPARLEARIRSVKTGEFLCIDASFVPMRDRDGTITHVLGTGVDVTQRSQVEAALASSRLRLAEAQRVAHIGSWEWVVGQDRVSWSDELYRIYAVDEADFVPTYQGFLARVHPDDVEHTKGVIRLAMENVTPFVYDHRVVRPDGEVRMLHTRGEVIGDEDGLAARLVGSCWDITDRWRATQELRASAEQLRALGARLDAIREEERRVIAREIHDQIGGALTALKLDLDWVRGQLDGEAGKATGARLAAMDALVDQTLETARRVSATLRPAILDDLGLPAAIAWQAREFEQRTGVACEAEVPADGEALAPATALVLFRIVQEALTNVARHAGARHVHIKLAVDHHQATLTVTDDGRGVTAEELGRPTSFGLAGMRERAIAAGGRATLTGSAGRGTTVSVQVPVADGHLR